MTSDPLDGPEEAAKHARREAEATVTELQPFKIVGQLIGARYNSEGDIIGEEVMGQVAIYRPNFGEVEKMVEEAVAQAQGASREGG